MTTLLTAFLLAHFEASASWWGGFIIVLTLCILHEVYKNL
jgi:hypothetical protein